MHGTTAVTSTRCWINCTVCFNNCVVTSQMQFSIHGKTSCVGGRHNMPHPCKLTFDLESGVQVTCDVAYLCANFSLPRLLCSRLRPDVRDRQTDVRCTSSLNAPYPRGRDIIMLNTESLAISRAPAGFPLNLANNPLVICT